MFILESDFKNIIDQLQQHKLWVETVGEQGKKLGLDEIDLRSIDLSDYSLDQAYFTECIFNSMSLQSSDFHNSVLCSSEFISTNLYGANFYKADLSYTNFSKSYMQSTKLAKADCYEAIFRDTDLTDANLVACLFYDTNFQNAILKNADISVASFKNVVLHGADLSGLRGVEEAIISSINIGTLDAPVILREEEAKRWIQSQAEK